MTQDVFIADASAHSYNLREDNYAAGRYSQAVVDAFHGAHYGLSPPGYRIPRLHFTRDWTLAETANMLFVESDYDFACHHVTPINAFKDGGCSVQKAREARERWPGRFQVYAGVDPVFQPGHMTAGAHLKLAERRELIRNHAVKSTATTS